MKLQTSGCVGRLGHLTWLFQTLSDIFLLNLYLIGPYWTNLDQFKPFCLFGPVYSNPNICTCPFGPVYFVQSIWTCLFGPVFLAPYIWNRLFVLNMFILICLLRPVHLDPPIRTCLFGSVYWDPLN